MIEGSPSDETELVWVEIVRSAVGAGDPHVLEAIFGAGHTADLPPHAESTVLVRVTEGGRVGSYQTGPGSAGELASAVRQALGQARLQAPGHWPCPPAPASEAIPASSRWVDPELARLEPGEARHLLETRARHGEAARLEWTVGRTLVANSSGLRQQAAATCADLVVACPSGPGSGRARSSSRCLEGLGLAATFERARERHAGDRGSPIEPPADALPLLLSPEAAASLLELLIHCSLSSRSFRRDSSCLAGKVGQRVLDRALTLVDDGTDEAGLPFPFDLFGYATKRLELVRNGTFRTPAVDADLAAKLGLEPTPHAVSPHNSRPGHVLVEAGELSPGELLETAGGGLWVGWLSHTECFDLPRGRFRALAEGVRSIEDGRLGPAVPDLVWEASLPEAFRELRGIGRERLSLAGGDGCRGGITTPALALAPTGSLTARS